MLNNKLEVVDVFVDDSDIVVAFSNGNLISLHRLRHSDAWGKNLIFKILKVMNLKVQKVLDCPEDLEKFRKEIEVDCYFDADESIMFRKIQRDIEMLRR